MSTVVDISALRVNVTGVNFNTLHSCYVQWCNPFKVIVVVVQRTYLFLYSIQRWATAYDDGTQLDQHTDNDSCLLGHVLPSKHDT